MTSHLILRFEKQIFFYKSINYKKKKKCLSESQFATLIPMILAITITHIATMEMYSLAQMEAMLFHLAETHSSLLFMELLTQMESMLNQKLV